MQVTVVGGGLAGCEAALQLAERGVQVVLVEMRPAVTTPIHATGNYAELVCSNSLKSLDPNSAAGCLKRELALLGSQLLAFALETQVPAGGALAVDRLKFSQRVEEAIASQPLIEVRREEIRTLEPYLSSDEPLIIATGPLTSNALSHSIQMLLGQDNLSFFDAAAPIIEADSLDHSVLFAQSRYGRGSTADYLNAPLSREEYDAFIDALVGAEKVITHDFERRELFSACQPIEEVARSGHDALRFGALKPVGLLDPRTQHRPWAAVQLRAENAQATAYNLVGFQTNLTFPEQRRVFSLIPGLEQAEFSRLGVMHRNTFVNAPSVLDATFAVPGHENIRFAGQICGTEGYTEAIASGLFAAACTYASLMGRPAPKLPHLSVLGALFDYATNASEGEYQPMHVNYGIIAPLEGKIKGKRERYAAYASRARTAMEAFISQRADLRFHSFSMEGCDE